MLLNFELFTFQLLKTERLCIEINYVKSKLKYKQICSVMV